MVNKQFSLVAHISTASPAKTEQVIAELVGRSSIQRTGDGFTVTAEMTGESARIESHSAVRAAAGRAQDPTAGGVDLRSNDGALF